MDIKAFISRIISFSKRKLTILLWEGSTQENTETYQVVPRKLLGFFVVSHLLVLGLVFLFFFLTPLGTLLFNREDQAMRSQIVEIRERVHQLRDSLYANELQLSNFKRALIEGADTTFVTGFSDQQLDEIYGRQNSRTSVGGLAGTESYTRGLEPEEIIFSNYHFFAGDLDFPNQFPLSGSLTRKFEPSNRHYGIDIAASEGSPVTAFSDGVVLFSGFTINYGHVVIIKHREGFVSVYKHCKNLAKVTGDFVTRGDVIGFVGDYGLVSSGPHLHFELWQNGIPHNPADYFQNIN